MENTSHTDVYSRLKISLQQELYVDIMSKIYVRKAYVQFRIGLSEIVTGTFLLSTRNPLLVHFAQMLWRMKNMFYGFFWRCILTWEINMEKKLMAVNTTWKYVSAVQKKIMQLGIFIFIILK